MKKTRIDLIGGRLDGACAAASPDEQEITLHETDSVTKLRTGRHFVYERKDERRFTFVRCFMEGSIVELGDGPMKGAKIQVGNDDVCILLPTMQCGFAAYVSKDRKWRFAKSFETEEEAEAYAKAYSNDKNTEKEN